MHVPNHPQPTKDNSFFFVGGRGNWEYATPSFQNPVSATVRAQWTTVMITPS